MFVNNVYIKKLKRRKRNLYFFVLVLGVTKRVVLNFVNEGVRS